MKRTNPTAKVSPKVASASSASAVAVVVAFIVGQVPVLRDAPTEVQAALITLLVAAVTFAAGYIKRDPARD